MEDIATLDRAPSDFADLPSCDDWELAHWFVQPNFWLAGAAPVDAISRDLFAVVQAARADRFAVIG